MKLTEKYLRKIIRESILLAEKKSPILSRGNKKKKTNEVSIHVTRVMESGVDEGGEVDTDVYEGDHDPITVEIPALESLATKENFEGEKVWHGESDALTIADALEGDEPKIEDYDYDEEEYEEASTAWNKVHDVLDGWADEDKEKLASNIRSTIKELDSSGYEY